MAKRASHKLTALSVERAKKRGRLGDGGGLWLNISHSGSKSWIYRWVVSGKAHEMGLGPYPVVKLAEAREAALECRRTVFAGKHPREERARERRVLTLGEVSTRFLEEMSPRWSNDKTRWQWHRSLTDQIAPIATVQMSNIETNHILNVLKPIWNETPESASRLRMRLEAVLDYANAHNLRSGENPARWKGHLEHLLAARSGLVRGHHKALPYAEIPTIMYILREQNSVGALALRFTILTAARTGEALKATWSEIDLENRLWVIPAARMKAKSEHRVPLCDEAIGIAKDLGSNRISEFVFPGQNPQKPLSNTSMTMTLRRLGYQDYTVHGMRSAFRDWCGDMTNVSREIAEAALAHRLGSSVELAYRRGDALQKRKILMTEWGKFCAESVHPRDH